MEETWDWHYDWSGWESFVNRVVYLESLLFRCGFSWNCPGFAFLLLWTWCSRSFVTDAVSNLYVCMI